jgi:hypothetical protein
MFLFFLQFFLHSLGREHSKKEMALVGDTVVDTVHFSGHPCILTTYLVLRLKSGFFWNFFAIFFGEMENFTGNLKHYIRGGG